MDMTLSVPVPRYVLKYIQVKKKLKPGQAWRIHTRGIEDVTFAALLERDINRKEIYNRNEVYLDIKVPAEIWLRKGQFFPQESVDAFCLFIKDLLKEEIAQYCIGLRSGSGLKRCNKVVTDPAHVRNFSQSKVRRIPVVEGIKFFSVKDSIIDFYEKYGITDKDLKFDSMQKHVQRRVPA